MRRVCSLEFRPHLLNSSEAGLADCLLSGGSERSLLPQSTIYNWSCGHFSRPLLTGAYENDEVLGRKEERERFVLDRIAKCQHSSINKLNNQIASWDTRFETGTKTTLLHPFSPVVIAADETERIRIWDYERAACLANELDDSLLLVASPDGNVRIWKDYMTKGGQKLVTAFSSVQGHKPGVRSMNTIVDWQQQSGYLFASGESSPILVWDLDKDPILNSIMSSQESSISALSASQVHRGHFAAGYVDDTVRLFDVRTPEMVVCTTQPHTERVVGIGFQPGLDPAKIISVSQAGDIQFLERNQRLP